MFSRRIPLADVVDLCRVLRHQLAAGLTVHHVFKKQAERGRRSYRAIAGRISAALQQGTGFADALEAERAAFPPLFLSMAKLGEATGHMAEIFGELERYYQLELQLRRQFRNASLLPIIQLVAAVLIVSGVIYILGLIASLNNNKPLIDFFGLTGAAGAAAFLGTVFGSLLLVWILYLLVARLGGQKAWMHRLLLALPALGPCLYYLAMSRLTLAMQLTLDSGLSITKALRLSLEATGDAHFAGRAGVVASALKTGKPLHEALEAARLFESDFMEMVVSAEMAGRVPEMMRTLAAQYQEETGRRMATLTRVAGGVVWCGVAGFIIWAIFRIASIYFDALAAAGA